MKKAQMLCIRALEHFWEHRSCCRQHVVDGQRCELVRGHVDAAATRRDGEPRPPGEIVWRGGRMCPEVAPRQLQQRLVAGEAA